MDQIAAPRIFIIDDDPFILEMYVIKFKEAHYEVEVAHDGKSGLEKILTTKPDILLLDVVMPLMDGFDVLTALSRDGFRPKKVILLTNLGQKEDIERGMKLGVDDYIIKAHFTPSEVVAKVTEIVNK